jgi:hypothetical protein
MDSYLPINDAELWDKGLFRVLYMQNKVKDL